MSRLSWPSRKQGEEGFTLVEVLVALMIVATALLVLAGTMYSAFGSIGFSRQRDTATELANQTMEQIKALNFADLVMYVPDISADPLVTCTPGTPPAPPTAPCTLGSSPVRTIPTVSLGTLPPAPLYPHTPTSVKPAVGTSNPGPTAYTISSYVTFDPNGNTQSRVATVVVTWNNPVKGASTSAKVQIESNISANGPLAGGTGHHWAANALDTAGTISVTGSFLGIPLANVSFGPGSASASIGPDGSATATGTVAPSTLQVLGSQTLLHTQQSNVGPATSPPGGGLVKPPPDVKDDSGTLGPLAGTSFLDLLLRLVGGTLSVTGGLGTQSTTGALAIGASDGSSVNLSNPAQTIPNSSLPYAQSMAKQTGPISLGLNLTLAGLSVLNVPLISVTPVGNSTPDMATVCQQTLPGCFAATPTLATVNQPSYGGSAIIAQAQKSFADITVLPSVTPPLLQIKGFTAAASAAAGPGINTGTANAGAATVSLLGGSTPTPSQLLAGVSKATGLLAGLLGTVGVTANLTFGSASPAGTNPATVSSPLLLNVGVSLPGVINVQIVINLGPVSANASYS